MHTSTDIREHDGGTEFNSTSTGAAEGRTWSVPQQLAISIEGNTFVQPGFSATLTFRTSTGIAGTCAYTYSSALNQLVLGDCTGTPGAPTVVALELSFTGAENMLGTRVYARVRNYASGCTGPGGKFVALPNRWGPTDYVARLDPAITSVNAPTTIAALASTYGLTVLETIPGPPAYSFHFQAASDTVATSLSADSAVTVVYTLPTIYPSAARAVPRLQFRDIVNAVTANGLAWHMDRLDQRTSLERIGDDLIGDEWHKSRTEITSELNFPRFFLVDNGVSPLADGLDPDKIVYLTGAVHAAAVNECTDHGTMTAGMLVSTKVGVAPGAKVFPISTFSGLPGNCSSNETRLLSIIAPGTTVYNEMQAGDVLVIPAGGGMFKDTEARIGHLIATKGIHVVVAAPNQRIPADEIPCKMPGVLCVGSTDASDAVVAADGLPPGLPASSNWGPNVDVLAPGIDVVLPRRRDTWGTPQIKYIRDRGTSFSAPAVAGVLALFQHLAYTSHPSLSRDGVRSLMLSNSDLAARRHTQIASYPAELTRLIIRTPGRPTATVPALPTAPMTGYGSPLYVRAAHVAASETLFMAGLRSTSAEIYSVPIDPDATSSTPFKLATGGLLQLGQGDAVTASDSVTNELMSAKMTSSGRIHVERVSTSGAILSQGDTGTSPVAPPLRGAALISQLAGFNGSQVLVVADSTALHFFTPAGAAFTYVGRREVASCAILPTPYLCTASLDGVAFRRSQVSPTGHPTGFGELGVVLRQSIQATFSDPNVTKLWLVVLNPGVSPPSTITPLPSVEVSSFPPSYGTGSTLTRCPLTSSVQGCPCEWALGTGVGGFGAAFITKGRFGLNGREDFYLTYGLVGGIINGSTCNDNTRVVLRTGFVSGNSLRSTSFAPGCRPLGHAFARDYREIAVAGECGAIGSWSAWTGPHGFFATLDRRTNLRWLLGDLGPDGRALYSLPGSPAQPFGPLDGLAAHPTGYTYYSLRRQSSEAFALSIHP